MNKQTLLNEATTAAQLFYNLVEENAGSIVNDIEENMKEDYVNEKETQVFAISHTMTLNLTKGISENKISWKVNRVRSAQAAIADPRQTRMEFEQSDN